MICSKCGKEELKPNHKFICSSCYHKQYYRENREKVLANAKKWYRDNKERKKEYDRQYRPRKPRSEWGVRQKDYIGPCIECGTTNKDTLYIKKMCKRCYRRTLYHINNPAPPPKNCSDCGIEIGAYSKTGMCRNCRHRFKYRTDEEYRNNFLKRNRKYAKSKRGSKMRRINVIKRRTLIANLEFSLTLEEWEDICKSYDYRCAYCGKKKKLEKDHIIPISKGGPTTKENIAPACRSCNSSKGDNIWKPMPPFN